MSNKTIADQLRALGVVPVEMAPAMDEQSEVQRIVQKRLASAKKYPEKTNLFEDAVDLAMNANITLKSDGSDFMKHSFSRWTKAARDDAGNATVFLGRLSVFYTDPVAFDGLLDLLAEQLARYRNKYIPRDDWVTAAEHCLSDARFQRSMRKAVRSLEKLPANYREPADLVDLLYKDVLNIHADLPHITFPVPELSRDDFQLCSLWGNYVDYTNEPIRDRRSLGVAIGLPRSAKLMSARAAELIVKSYYQELGHIVEDISIRQIVNTDVGWMTHDLNVDGKPVDVKNARRSLSSKNSYSEFFVRKLKEVASQDAHSEVTITGTLSEYVSFHGTSRPFLPPTVLVLGEVSRRTLDRAQVWMKDRTHDHLDLVNFAEPRFFPAWFFEYPESHYRKRETVIKTWKGIMQSALDSGLAWDKVPLFSLPFLDEGNHGGLTPQQAALLQTIRDLDRTLGLTRLSAVLLILSELIRASIGITSEFASDEIARYVFPFGGKTGRKLLKLPFVRIDELGVVDNMLKATNSAWQLARAQLREFKRFQLLGPSILRGDDGGGRWTTILAYCGGLRISPPGVPCGMAPLILGEHRTCSACLRLICPECSYCGKGCRSGELRQEKLKARLTAQDK